MSKYQKLEDHLQELRTEEWRTSFQKIEKIIGGKLPPSARAYPAWWSNNDSNNVMTKAWLAAGWKTESLDIPCEKVTFRKTHWERSMKQSAISIYTSEHNKNSGVKEGATIKLLGVPQPEIRILKRRAAASQRTLEAEIIGLIRRETSGHDRLERARCIQELTPQGTHIDLAKIIREGRDER